MAMAFDKGLRHCHFRRSWSRSSHITVYFLFLNDDYGIHIHGKMQKLDDGIRFHFVKY